MSVFVIWLFCPPSHFRKKEEAEDYTLLFSHFLLARRQKRFCIILRVPLYYAWLSSSFAQLFFLVYFVRLIGQKRSMFPSFLIYFPNVTTQVARESSRYFIETVYHPPPSQKIKTNFALLTTSAATETVVVAVNGGNIRKQPVYCLLWRKLALLLLPLVIQKRGQTFRLSLYFM